MKGICKCVSINVCSVYTYERACSGYSELQLNNYVFSVKSKLIPATSKRTCHNGGV
jgi:hypothetical protein